MFPPTIDNREESTDECDPLAFNVSQVCILVNGRGVPDTVQGISALLLSTNLHRCFSQDILGTPTVQYIKITF